MRISVLFLLLAINCVGFAQVSDSNRNNMGLVTPVTAEQQLENATENNGDIETEDDFYLQQMLRFQKDPININNADPALLNELLILTPLQIQCFITYRSLMGKLISVYELQAIPGWDITIIQRLLPYISVNIKGDIVADLKERLRGGEHTVLLRISQTMERSKGYIIDSAATKNYYAGSPQKIMLRYKYVFKNLLQYGIMAEKDAGEEFFRGRQKKGFDFYSAHLFIRRSGIIKSLALGDFTVNFGQGLIQWQNLAFKKGPDVTSVKRQSAVLRPYNSAGEINFHRGAGITIGRKNWEATVFGSYKKTDANYSVDSLQASEDHITSLQISGYHRTLSEINDKGIQHQIVFGANAAVDFRRVHIGINGIKYGFKYPLVKDPLPYNLYALKGNHLGNYSIDYSYTFQNMHFFGEAATSGNKRFAFIHGLLISMSGKVDMSFLYRNISVNYQSLYSNAFTESTLPSNEKGFFTGIIIRPLTPWIITAYTDFYKFPWLKYRVDAPSAGTDYFIQLIYKPNKLLEIYTRYKKESKGINYNPDGLLVNPVVQQPKKNWRLHLNYKVSASSSLQIRTEIIWFDRRGEAEEEGFLMYGDYYYKPVGKPFTGNIRLEYFETGSYNSRLYAYEADVLYYFSIPVLYGHGYRAYLNFSYDVTKKLSCWMKFIRSYYPLLQSIGSGLDEITGNKKTEIRLQLLYKL